MTPLTLEQVQALHSFLQAGEGLEASDIYVSDFKCWERPGAMIDGKDRENVTKLGMKLPGVVKFLTDLGVDEESAKALMYDVTYTHGVLLGWPKAAQSVPDLRVYPERLSMTLEGTGRKSYGKFYWFSASAQKHGIACHIVPRWLRDELEPTYIKGDLKVIEEMGWSVAQVKMKSECDRATYSEEAIAISDRFSGPVIRKQKRIAKAVKRKRERAAASSSLGNGKPKPRAR